MMKLLDTPWIARKIADRMTPTLTISLLPNGGVRMINENPLHTRDQELPADGTERTRTDPLGRKVVSSEIWNDLGQLVVTEQNYVENDHIEVVTSTWARVDDRLELTLRALSADGPMSIRRVLDVSPRDRRAIVLDAGSLCGARDDKELVVGYATRDDGKSFATRDLHEILV